MEESLELYRKNKIFYYRPDIDGLRAIAVLFVIVFHTFPTLLAGGFIGVDIFFVVSGFLISGIILEALHNNSFSYVNFYARRIRRIFPALIVVLASCLVAGWFVFFSGEYFNLAKETIYGAGFLSNIGYWLESGYFDISSSLKPLVHLWSLGIEEQFYLVWPVLLVFLYKRTKKIPLSILIFLALSFFLDYTITLKNPTTAFYMPFCRFWELMAGAFLSYVTLFKGGLIKNITDKFKITFSEKKNILILEALSCVGILSIFIPAFVIKSKEIYIGWILLAVIGVFLLIASGANTFINKYILSNRVLVGIGLISYPLYLWHWPLLAFARIINGDVVSVNVRIVLIITSFILAWLTYLFIEKPIRHSKKKIVPIILFSIIIVIAIMGIAICKNNGFNFRFPMQEKTLKEVSLVARKIFLLFIKMGFAKNIRT